MEPTTTEYYVLVMLYFLLAEQPEARQDELHPEFFRFYGREVTAEEFHGAVSALRDREILAADGDHLSLTPGGRAQAHKAALEFGFAEGSQMSANSAAEKKLEADLSARGYITITDEAQRAFVATALRGAAEPVIDVGCGSGQITALLAEATGKAFVGVDSSAERLSEAKSLHPKITFVRHAMEEIENLPVAFGSAVLIDSLYFVQDQAAVIRKLLAGLPDNGRIVLLYGSHAGPGMEESVLKEEALPFWSVLQQPDVAYEIIDFSSNEHTIWETRVETMKPMKPAFEAEGRGYLYWSGYLESRALASITGRGANARRGIEIKRRF
jgi:trans-aconitate methyltransferase